MGHMLAQGFPFSIFYCTVTTVTTLKRAKTSQAVVDYVQREIFEGRLRPGDRIDVDGVATALGVSPTPVRKALTLLERDGVISKPRARAAYIEHFDAHTLLADFHVLGMLSGVAVPHGSRWTPLPRSSRTCVRSSTTCAPVGSGPRAPRGAEHRDPPGRAPRRRHAPGCGPSCAASVTSSSGRRSTPSPARATSWPMPTPRSSTRSPRATAAAPPSSVRPKPVPWPRPSSPSSCAAAWLRPTEPGAARENRSAALPCRLALLDERGRAFVGVLAPEDRGLQLVLLPHAAAGIGTASRTSSLVASRPSGPLRGDALGEGDRLVEHVAAGTTLFTSPRS